MNNNPAISTPVLVWISRIVLKQGRRPTCQKRGRAAEGKNSPESVSRLLEKSRQRHDVNACRRKESSTAPVRRGFLVTEIAKKLIRSGQNHRQPEEIGDDEAERRRYRLAELPLFRLADATDEASLRPLRLAPAGSRLYSRPFTHPRRIPSAFASERVEGDRRTNNCPSPIPNSAAALPRSIGRYAVTGSVETADECALCVENSHPP